MSDYFLGKNLEEEWKNLYGKIERKIDRWSEVTKGYTENDGFLNALRRLLPLAKELQNDDSLHHLMPWQHHGVLDLRLMDWEKQRTYAFLSILPKKNVYMIRTFPHITQHYPRPPLKTIESVPLGEIRSLIHAELQATTAQRSTAEPK